MKRKIVLPVFISLYLIASLVTQLQLGSGEEDYIRYEPWVVCGTLVLEWDLYPWHTVKFVDCDVGFNITCDNTVLDLNGHRAVFVRESELGPGRTGIEIIGRSGVTIKNGTISNFQYGIWIEKSNEVDITFNNVSAATRQGIGLRNSNSVRLAFNIVSEPAIIGIGIDQDSFDISMINNKITGSGKVGIGVDQDSFDISMINNKITGSGDVGIGVYDECFDISMINNTVTASGDEGVHLADSNYIVVSGNNISDCRKGIYLYNSHNNTIDSNTLSNNTVSGIHLESASQSIIYHNNFIHNKNHVTNVESTNSWDVGYGTVKDAGYGGNCWDDYEGVDEYSGANKNVLGSDGIGDTPYDKIGEGNQDNYPLMNPLGSMLTELETTLEDVTCYVAVFSNSSVTDLSFSKAEAEISFTASNGTFCRVVIPRETLDGSFNMSIDGITTVYVLNWDKSHHFISFDIDNGTHKVKITGEIAIRGDLNGDGKVNINDLYIVAKNFGKQLEK